MLAALIFAVIAVFSGGVAFTAAIGVDSGTAEDRMGSAMIALAGGVVFVLNFLIFWIWLVVKVVT